MSRAPYRHERARLLQRLADELSIVADRALAHLEDRDAWAVDAHIRPLISLAMDAYDQLPDPCAWPTCDDLADDDVDGYCAWHARIRDEAIEDERIERARDQREEGARDLDRWGTP